jgi:hypothetical protein
MVPTGTLRLQIAQVGAGIGINVGTATLSHGGWKAGVVPRRGLKHDAGGAAPGTGTCSHAGTSTPAAAEEEVANTVAANTASLTPDARQCRNNTTQIVVGIRTNSHIQNPLMASASAVGSRRPRTRGYLLETALVGGPAAGAD